MKIYRKELWAAIHRYASVLEADSWKDGGDDLDAILEIEKELMESDEQLDKLIRMVIPVCGVKVGPI